MVQTCKAEPQADDRLECCERAEELLDPELFRALCDPTRLFVLMRLAERGDASTVSEVAGCCPVDLSVVSRHLATLRRAGVVTAERRGKENLYTVRYSALAATLRRMADAIDACCPEPPKPNETPNPNEESPS